MGSKEYFEEVVEDWDQMRSEFFSTAVREKAYAVAELKSDSVAADIGAGTGFITEGLLKEGVKVIAVDQSPKMLETLKNKFEDEGELECREGIAKNLPLKDESVDYIFANMFLHHVKSPAETIKEMVRALKKGGKLIITDLDKHDLEFLRTKQQDRWLGFPRDDIKKWLNQVGLKNIQVDCADSNCCAESESGSEKANVSIFVAYGEK